MKSPASLRGESRLKLTCSCTIRHLSDGKLGSPREVSSRAIPPTEKDSNHLEGDCRL